VVDPRRFSAKNRSFFSSSVAGLISSTAIGQFRGDGTAFALLTWQWPTDGVTAFRERFFDLRQPAKENDRNGKPEHHAALDERLDRASLEVSRPA
jgi:hypothetical protein